MKAEVERDRTGWSSLSKASNYLVQAVAESVLVQPEIVPPENETGPGTVAALAAVEIASRQTVVPAVVIAK